MYIYIIYIYILYMIYGFRKIRVSQNIQVIGPILGLKPLWLTTPACSRLFSTSSCCRASRSVSNCAVSSVSCAVLLSIFAWCSPTTGDQMVPKCGKDQGHKPSGDAVYHHIYGDFGGMIEFTWVYHIRGRENLEERMALTLNFLRFSCRFPLYRPIL